MPFSFVLIHFISAKDQHPCHKIDSHEPVQEFFDQKKLKNSQILGKGIKNKNKNGVLFYLSETEFKNISVHIGIPMVYRIEKKVHITWDTGNKN